MSGHATVHQFVRRQGRHVTLPADISPLTSQTFANIELVAATLKLVFVIVAFVLMICVNAGGELFATFKKLQA